MSTTLFTNTSVSGIEWPECDDDPYKLLVWKAQPEQGKGRHVLLVVPPYITCDPLVANLYPMPLAAVSLAACLEANGWRVTIKDFLLPVQKSKATKPKTMDGKGAPPYMHYGMPMGECLAWLHKHLHKYDVVGLCAGQCNLWESSAKLAVVIRQAQKPLVIGGAFVTTALQQAAAVFGPAVYVKGEGEGVVGKAMAYAIQRQQKGSKHSSALLLGNRMVLDSLPLPAWHLAPPENYPKQGNRVRCVLTVSRGCPHRCVFCSVSTVMGKRYRRMSDRRIKEHLEHLLRWGVRYFCFLDDNLLINEDKANSLLKIVQGLPVSKLKPWYYIEEGVEVRVAATKGLVKRLVAGGFKNIALGMETANSNRAKQMRKPYTGAQLKQAVRECKKAGITPLAFYIVGLPGDTVQSVAKDFVQFGKLGLAVRANNLKVYPGTALHKVYRQRGYISSQYDWRLSTFYTPDTEWLTYKDIKKLKAILNGIGCAAQEFGIAVFNDSLECCMQKVNATRYTLTKSGGKLVMTGNFFRPTPYRKMLELMLLQAGAEGVHTVLSESKHAIIATPTLPADKYQWAIAKAVAQG